MKKHIQIFQQHGPNVIWTKQLDCIYFSLQGITWRVLYRDKNVFSTVFITCNLLSKIVVHHASIWSFIFHDNNKLMTIFRALWQTNFLNRITQNIRPHINNIGFDDEFLLRVKRHFLGSGIPRGKLRNYWLSIRKIIHCHILCVKKNSEASL